MSDEIGAEDCFCLGEKAASAPGMLEASNPAPPMPASRRN